MQWVNIYEFCTAVSPDLSNYDLNGAWPVLLDEFGMRFFLLPPVLPTLHPAIRPPVPSSADHDMHAQTHTFAHTQLSNAHPQWSGTGSTFENET